MQELWETLYAHRTGRYQRQNHLANHTFPPDTPVLAFLEWRLNSIITEVEHSQESLGKVD